MMYLTNSSPSPFFFLLWRDYVGPGVTISNEALKSHSHNWSLTCTTRRRHFSRPLYILFLSLEEWLSNFTRYQNHLEDLLKQILVGPVPRISFSEGLGKGLGTFVSNKFSVDAAAAGLETHFEKCWPKTLFYCSYPMANSYSSFRSQLLFYYL